MSQGVHLRKYGVQATIDFDLYEVDGVDLRVDWVPAKADCEVMKDGGASTECTNTATDEGSTYSIVLTTTEMQAARIVLKVVDVATKVFLDKVIIIETYGHASAQHAIDLDDGVRAGLTALPNAAANAAGGLPISAGGGLALDTQLANTNEITAARMGALTDWIDGGRLDLILDIIAADTTTDIPALIAALNNISTAQVNAQVLDVLNVDTFAEPGQEAPAATTTLVKKIGYLYKFLRNKVTNDGTNIKVYNDAGAVVDQKNTVSEAAGTVTRGKFGTGP